MYIVLFSSVCDIETIPLLQWFNKNQIPIEIFLSHNSSKKNISMGNNVDCR